MTKYFNYKKFTSQILKLRPEFSVVERNYFYEPPVDHFLHGVYWDRRSPQRDERGRRYFIVYMGTYTLPLYVRDAFRPLRYSERLPPDECIMEITPGEEKAAAEEFVRRIQPYESRPAARLEQFAEYIAEQYDDMHMKEVDGERPRIPPYQRLEYALTMIMLGHADVAKHQLEILDSYIRADERPPPYLKKNLETVSILLGNLSEGIEVAQEILQKWEVETKRNWGLITPDNE